MLKYDLLSVYSPFFMSYLCPDVLAYLHGSRLHNTTSIMIADCYLGCVAFLFYLVSIHGALDGTQR